MLHCSRVYLGFYKTDWTVLHLLFGIQKQFNYVQYVNYYSVLSLLGVWLFIMLLQLLEQCCSHCANALSISARCVCDSVIASRKFVNTICYKPLWEFPQLYNFGALWPTHTVHVYSMLCHTYISFVICMLNIHCVSKKSKFDHF